MGYNAITSLPESSTARVRLDVTTVTAGATFYVFRRDSAGTNVVRETSGGDRVTDAGADAIVYDYEARQGEATDYILTDADGTTLATVRDTIPAWGTWIKSPSLPYLNTLVYFGGQGKHQLSARRELLQIEDSQYAVALTHKRAAPAGEIVLSTRTLAQRDALVDVLRSGETLMLDCAPQWGVPFRYISVGDVDVARVFDELGLDNSWRVFTLGGVVEVAPPLGVSSVDPGKTYDQLPVDFGTYAAIPATVATYNDLVL